MDRLSSFSKIFLIFVWLMLGVGSAFAAWDGSIATTAPRDTSIGGKTYYLIDSEAKLAWFSVFVNQNKNNSAKANAKLMADLDMGGELWTPICAGTGGNKDGKTYCKYQGTFDGNGHVIKNLYINGDGLAQEDKNFAQNLGFIGVLGSGTVKNLILENVDIHATTSIGSLLGADNQISVGSFVGWMADVDNNVVEKCMVTGSIRTTGNGQGVGGIVGNAKKGTISDCLSLVEIMTSGSQAYVGGIIGIIKTDVTVTSCVYAGPGLVNIGTNGAVGGIAGNVFSGTLTTNNDYYEVNNYYEGNEINGVGKNCKTSNCTNNTEKVDISNKEEIACKLNGGKYNDATCDKTGAWSIGETTLSLFDYGVDGYKIYFYANGGKFADGSEAKNKFLDVGMTITPEDVEDPSHDDKTFIGWSLERNATEPAENLGTVSESDTVFAVWQPKLTVTFDVSPGDFPDENVKMKSKKMDKGAVVTVGSLGTLPTSYCKTPSSTGDGCDELRYFTGWAENAYAAESDTIHLEDYYATDDVTLYAVWTDAETYTVTYNANGHGKTRVDYVRVGKGKTITVPVDPVAHDGYKFAGWFIEESCENPFNFTTKIHESIVLYAKWIPITYSITYNIGEGLANAADNPNEYNVESENIDLKAPTPAVGYAFDDWFVDEAFSKKVTRIAKGSTGDKTFYAKWSSKTYRITYLADNNSYGSVSDQIKQHGSLITLLSSGIFNRKGCEQDGWATEANGARVYDLGASYRNNADLTLFPSWKAINYTIEYVCKDCINDPTNPTEYNVLRYPSIRYASVVPEGYKFGGWFKEKSYENKVTQIADGTTGNIVLYGKLNEIYNITYIGTDKPQSATTYTVDDAVKLNDPKAREGYVFGGWYDNKEFTGDKITNIVKGSTGDKTFYAKWTNSENGNVLAYHTITYVVDEKVFATDAYTEDDAVTLADLTKDGYKLDGWYTEVSDEDGSLIGDKVTGFAAGATDDKIFYAQSGNPIEYTATYNLNEGSMDGELSFTFTVKSENIELPTPTRNGYTFAGWFDSKAKKVIKTLPKGSIGDRTLTAQWVAEKYTITYLNIENATNANPTTYTVENKITLADAQKTDYTFLGWYDSGDNLVSVIPKKSTGNKILTARWSNPQEYTISYNLNGGKLPSGETNPEKYNIETLVTKLVEPEKDNHEFVGWFSEENVKYEEIGGSMTGNLELTARWFAPSFSITYKIDGNDADLTPNKYTVDDNVMLPAPTKNGYTFDGWYVNDELSGNKVTGFDAGATANKAFFGKWNKNEYTITYVVDGANANLTPNKYTVEDAVKLATPIKAGYVFEGWFDDETGYVITDLSKGSFGDKSFSAFWSDPIEYHITYVIDGDNVDLTPSEYTVEDDVTLPTPTKKGYTFVGWFDSENKQVTEIKKGSTGDLNLTAKWSDPIEYTISYNNVEGASNTNPTNYSVISETITLADAEKDGYNFEGWFDSENNQVTEIKKGSTGDLNLTAKWSDPIEYTISYKNVENATNDNPTTYTVESDTIQLFAAVKAGYVFAGWFDKDGEEVTAIAKGSTGNIELTAKWEGPIAYTITYELNGGTIAENANPTTYTVETAATSLVAPTKDDYDFEGWFTADNVKYEEIGGGIVGNLKLIAHWTATSYSITYVLNEGELPEGVEIPQTYTIESEDITLPTPTKSGYTFAGWYDQNDNYIGYTIYNQSSGNITLYARWNGPIEYTIAYNNIEGATNENPVTYTVESETIQLANAVKNGYTFEGWFDKDGKQVIEITKGSTGNLNLTAKWSAIHYTITYVTANGANSYPNVNSYTVEDVAGDKVIDLKPATRCGFEFAGWFKDKDLLGDAVAQIKNGDAENITLYPKWEKITDPEEDYGAVKIYKDKNGLKCAAMDGYFNGTVEISSDVEVSYVTLDREFLVNETAENKLSTIVLPFNIAKSNIVGASFYEMLYVISQNTENQKRGVYISPTNDDVILANKPYIIRTTKANLTFNIDKEANQKVTLNTSESKNTMTDDNQWTLVGMYRYKKWLENDKELGYAYGYTAKSTNKLAAGQFDINEAGAYIVPFRAYLLNVPPKAIAPRPFLAKSASTTKAVNDLSQTASLDVFVIDGSVAQKSEIAEIGENGGMTSIITVKTSPARMKIREGWYDMKGRRLNGEPSAKGIYYYNGKKIRIQ